MPTINLKEILTEIPQPPDWVVERFIPRDTITILVGLEGIGKSSLSYYLALCVALGVPFLGRPTTQLKVLYFDSENSTPDCGEYLRKLWVGLGCPSPLVLDQFLRVEHFSLSHGWQKEFNRHCREFEPGLIIVDTANACFSIKDENSNAEAAEIISFVQKTRPARAAIILMKHEREPKDGVSKSVRGAKYWLGAVDQVVYLQRQPGRPTERLHRTKLVPAKHRAYGLDEPINITPKELEGVYGKGLIFNASNVPPS